MDETPPNSVRSSQGRLKRHGKVAETSGVRSSRARLHRAGPGDRAVSRPHSYASAAPAREDFAAAGAAVRRYPKMPTVPTSRLGKIQFYEDHLPAWLTNAEAIGLTEVKLAEFSPLVVAARTAYDAQQAALNAARAATVSFHNAVRAMHSDSGAGADLIKTIRAYAESTGNPNVYVLAQIPPPATPGQAPPPGTPFDLQVGLLQSGALELRWKCHNPSGVAGTIYEILRRDSSGGSFEYAGSIGIKSYVDETVPSGIPSVTYQITAVRSTLRGKPAQFTVNFGVSGRTGTATIASVMAETPARRAA